MTMVILTETKLINKSFEVLNQCGTEIDLESILINDFQQELPSDINNIA